MRRLPKTYLEATREVRKLTLKKVRKVAKKALKRKVPRMKKLKLLLLDANVVIELFEKGIWEKVVERCEIYLAGTVVDEAQHIPDAEDGYCKRSI